jgi:hypothetical protein
MVTKFLVHARDCYSIDPQRISEAGGRFLGIGALEEDGTATVDVDITADDRDASRRITAMFAQHFA